MADDSTDFTFSSSVRGFHHYQRVWLPLIGQRLSDERELHNPEDRFAVAAMKHSSTGDTSVVGHLPREISRVLWYFLLHGGEIDCEVIGERRRSPLVQGGLEIPCHVTL